jgi:hypothetical protein
MDRSAVDVRVDVPMEAVWVTTKTPYLANRAAEILGVEQGRTIGTAAAPETSDEQEPPDAHVLTSGAAWPWLARASVEVPDADLSGKSIATKMGAETSDEGDDDR